MQNNNFLNRILLSMVLFKSEKIETKEDAFKKTKELLLSTKNKEDLANVVKLINHFNKTYTISSEDPEFIYFTKIINLMRLVIRKKYEKSDDKNDESQRRCEIELEKY